MEKNPFNIPNFFSMLRLLLIPFFFLSMYYFFVKNIEIMLWVARGIFVVIFLSDFLDGFLARRWGEITALGSVLDPVADKLFVIASFVLLAVFDKLSAWLTVTVVAKDILVSIGWSLKVLLYETVEVNPSSLGKMATAMQFFIIFTIVMFLPQVSILWLEILTVVLTLAALIQYGYQFMQLAGGYMNGNLNKKETK
jgi:CDP-diacylglycerol--glycerol-3-phosphate 3-phosphatidyltransferase